jgi:ATP-dependent helicase/DNAse subunit B
MVKGFLMKELEVIRTETIDILSVEQRLERTIVLNGGHNNIEIKFKGYADRIDRIGGMLRIGDYKTGKTEARDLTFETIEQLFTDPGKEKALQLMCYSWLLKHQHKNEQITAAIYTLKSPRNYQLHLSQQKEKSAEALYEIPNEFEEMLKTLVSDLLNPSIPFSQTDDTDICELCAYRAVCHTL